jgi:hypothetical protein
MGLAISRSIIEAHGGLLWAARETQADAEFRFALPMEVEDASSASSKPDAQGRARDGGLHGRSRIGTHLACALARRSQLP